MKNITKISLNAILSSLEGGKFSKLKRQLGNFSIKELRDAGEEIFMDHLILGNKTIGKLFWNFINDESNFKNIDLKENEENYEDYEDYSNSEWEQRNCYSPSPFGYSFSTDEESDESENYKPSPFIVDEKRDEDLKKPIKEKPLISGLVILKRRKIIEDQYRNMKGRQNVKEFVEELNLYSKKDLVKYIDLRDNFFVGNGLSKILPALLQFKNLEYIDLTCNNLSINVSWGPLNEFLTNNSKTNLFINIAENHSMINNSSVHFNKAKFEVLSRIIWIPKKGLYAENWKRIIEKRDDHKVLFEIHLKFYNVYYKELPENPFLIK